MKLYMKSILSKEPFKEYVSGINIDLNLTLFMLEVDKDVDRVVVNGKEIIFGGDGTSIVFNIYERSPKEEIEIVIDFHENDCKKSYTYTIPVGAQEEIKEKFLEDVKVFHDKYLHFLGKDVVLKDLYRQQYDMDQKLGLLEKIRKYMQEINKLCVKISQNPQVKLLEEDVLVEPRKAKRFNQNTLVHFMTHPEYWHKERFMEPKPLKVLTETYREVNDTYENKLILHYIWKCMINCRKITEYLEDAIIAAKDEVTKLEGELETYESQHQKLERIYEKELLESLILSLEDEKDLFYILGKQLKRSLDLFGKIKGYKEIREAMTQKILYDKRYFRVYTMYKKLEVELLSIFEEKLPIHEDYYHDYIFMIIFTLSFYIRQLDFQLVGDVEGLLETDTRFFESSNQIKMTYALTSNKYNIRAIIDGFSLAYKDDELRGKVVLQLVNEKQDKIRINIHPLMMGQQLLSGEYLQKIKNLYEKIVEQGDHHYQPTSNYIFYNIPLTAQSLGNLHIEEETEVNLAMFLSNAGNNFIDQEDYQRFGNFKAGMIPITFSNYDYQSNKLMNLLRMHLVRLGVKEKCLFCGNEYSMRISESGELFTCSCGKRWAINHCNNCGEEIIKFPIDGKPDKKYENPLKFHNEYEIKSKFIGACYSEKKYYDKGGGICPRCGSCFKESGELDCIRCKLRKEKKLCNSKKK